ncbi:peptide chain release factor N(5)-glutamine methyltransferase [Aliidiomarina sedimenti]|uniref:Release factor glutamine methyltransferase n=1 Tax=Aliidiomarina sedimenti TaxID=1933879 RepID=A0ABY0C2N3_9GAMM|nr:peptide chain release factor N(5)-glutamine methyltransferase [Aliidiomarina sedimenti]RUO32121.1 peptide chain release factor N(5)-glutamine methyltransferase [Aliidiomarina sedimenti]
MKSYYVISRAINYGKTQVALGGSDSALLDAQLLLQHVLGCDRQYLYMHPEQGLDDQQWQNYRTLIEKRRDGYPVAHLVGFRDFWDLTLAVNDSTLIPRPDSEILVEQALLLALKDDAKVLELGTGTGAIALALANERPRWQLTALDKSAEAVQLATTNRDRNGLTDRLTLLQSDWFAALKAAQRFDLIISNPPYIDPDDAHLQLGDVRFEPRSALVADDQGYADLRFIIEQAPEHLNPGAWVMLEHGFAQGPKVRAFFSEKGYEKVNTVTDYANLDRVTFAQWIND